ncbi:MAG: hypothetical protein MR286_08410 [Clostridiales bacterium]|nr:hypothetical protein [Clostridiales bacterium]
MNRFLQRIRTAGPPTPYLRQCRNTALLLLLGIGLGILAKYLDVVPRNELPDLISALDVGNFLGRFAPWVVFGLGISLASRSPVRAAVNVFVFFVGMVAGYYGYSSLAAGFFPRHYAMIWVAFTLVSPLLAGICWYAKGNGAPALVLSSLLLAVLFNMTFVYGIGYFEPRSFLELLCFLGGVVLLNRTTLKKTLLMAAASVGIALALDQIIPFHFG